MSMEAMGDAGTLFDDSVAVPDRLRLVPDDDDADSAHPLPTGHFPFSPLPQAPFSSPPPYYRFQQR